MKKRLSVVVAALLAVSAFGVSQASAATEFGSGCAAELGGPGVSAISIKHGAANPLPAAAPVSGVITEWRFSLNLKDAEEEEFPPGEEEEIGALYRPTLQVYQGFGAGVYHMVGESFGTSIVNLKGTTTNSARVPVQAGDYLGLGGIALICESPDPADEIALRAGNSVVPGTYQFENKSELQVPVVAKIEPDVDGDGYGDETQDKCPQSAAYQTACPVVTIGSKPFVGKKAVTLYVATSLSAPVGVTATVSLGNGKKATLNAATKTVAPGTVTPFKLALTKTVTKALEELPTKQSLQLSIVASATNVTGSPSTRTSKVKLRGRAKPTHHKKDQKSQNK